MAVMDYECKANSSLNLFCIYKDLPLHTLFRCSWLVIFLLTKTSVTHRPVGPFVNHQLAVVLLISQTVGLTCQNKVKNKNACNKSTADSPHFHHFQHTLLLFHTLSCSSPAASCTHHPQQPHTQDPQDPVLFMQGGVMSCIGFSCSRVTNMSATMYSKT